MQKYCEILTPKGVMRGFLHEPLLPQYPICIIFHGFTGNKTGTKFSYVQLSRLLAQSGIGTLRMDFLGSGESDLEFKDMTFQDELDCGRLLIEEMKNNSKVTDIYLLGHSMGGAIASELMKLYPNLIKKACLWAPALNLPEHMDYLKGKQERQEFYDHNGFKISNDFVDGITQVKMYEDLGVYKNKLMIIHGTHDMTVPFKISTRYLPLYNNPEFIPIEGGTHNFDKIDHIESVIGHTLKFFML